MDIGVRAFLPGSQIDVRPVRNLDALRGQELRMRVIKVNKKRGNIVLSRKVLLEEENAEKKKHTLDTLAEGKVLRGSVKNITDYGAFIDLGGIDGLLHITDMSWGRVTHPSELFKRRRRDRRHRAQVRPGDRARLARPQAAACPIRGATSSSATRSACACRGKVVSLTDYGAFIELEPGVEGLIHVSEMSWSKRVKHPSKILNVGDSVEAMVLGVDPGARRISLGLKQVESNPWHELAEQVPGRHDDHRQGAQPDRVRRVRRGRGGHRRPDPHLGHVVEQGLKHPSEVLKKGDTVEAQVLSIDAENQRLSLGLKQLQTGIWKEFFDAAPRRRHRRGQGRAADQLRRVRRAGGRHRRPDPRLGVRDSSQGGEKLELQAGESYQMKIIRLVPSERKIGLSIRALKDEEFRADWEAYTEIDRPAGSDARRSLQAPASRTRSSGFQVRVPTSEVAAGSPEPTGATNSGANL